tara:strand:- start:836 stop:1423 length:588 start_codon:yes stop_codon:yes gene_type:complete
MMKKIIITSSVLLIIGVSVAHGNSIKKAENTLNHYISGLARKTTSNKLDIFDKTIIGIGFNSMIAVGYFSYPEAAAILRHYIHGEGEDLLLSNDYFKKSKFIQRTIKTKGVGKHKISLRQHQDWRISYALNPFILHIKKNGTIKIYQKIVFKHPKRKVRTTLNLFGFKVKVNDGLVHAMKPSPFMVYVKPWKQKI